MDLENFFESGLYLGFFGVHGHSASIVNCQPVRPLIRGGPFYPMTFVLRNRQVITGAKFNSIRLMLNADACSAFSAPPLRVSLSASYTRLHRPLFGTCRANSLR